MSENRFAGRVALVTGAAGGIGRAVAERLGSEGAEVIGVDLDADRLGWMGSRGVVTDLSLEACAPVLAEAIGAFPQLDVLVNAAAIAEPGSVEDISISRWNRTFAVNVTSMFLTVRAALPALRAANGAAIVNVSSIAGRSKSLMNGIDYTTTKAAVLGFTRHLAAELAPDRIRVNATCPGPTDTPMLSNSLARADREELESRLPMRRLATAEEQAAAIAFLCSDDSAYINGATLDVNGGAL